MTTLKMTGAEWWRVNLKNKFTKDNYLNYTTNPTFRLGRLMLYDDTDALLGSNLTLEKFSYPNSSVNLFEDNYNTIQPGVFTTYPACVGNSSWDEASNLFKSGTSGKWYNFILLSDDESDWGVAYNGNCGPYLSIVMHFTDKVKIRKWNLRHGNDDSSDGEMSFMRWIQIQASNDGKVWTTQGEFEFDLPAVDKELYYEEPQNLYQ